MPNAPKSGFRFAFGGVNLTSVPDAIPPEKFASALNVRAYSPTSLRTRPGYTFLFSTGNNSITDIQSYAAIETDNDPRFLARDSAGKIWLDNGHQVGNMASPQGYGASMLPWRPSQSPQTWMYVATEGDYQKFSAPDANNNVTQYKVGIAEPQLQVEAGVNNVLGNVFSGNAATWGNGGTAGATSDVTLTSDTAGSVFADPVVSSRYYVQVSATTPYVVGQIITINSIANVVVEDVLPPIASGSSGLTIQAIRYASGSSGACQITCAGLPIGTAQAPGGIGSLRRGALVYLNSSEIALVLSSTQGDNGSVMFETSTSGTFSAGQSITGIPAILIGGVTSAVAGTSISSAVVDSTITAGTASLSQNLATSPFAVEYGLTTILPREDDYVHLLLNVGAPLAISQIGIYFNVGTSFDLTDAYVYTVTGSMLVNSDSANLTEIMFPISALTQSGKSGGTTSTGDIRTLANCNGVSLQIVCTATTTFQFGSIWIGGGGLPDIGNSGAEYQYKIVPRSTTTGAQGNASPTMRYGVSPRRQSVKIVLPSTSSTLPATDAQVDIWDVYRYGGSVTSYRYIGSGAPSTTFTDNYFDDTANAGQPLPTQNYEPWPSVDVPYKVVSGGGTTITATGTQVVVSGPSSWPSTINNWLPGTLILLGGQNAYTLRSRPTQLSSTSYLFNLVECAGSISASLLSVNEPQVASQKVPYMWGPDANGYFFAVGDPLRPGVIYFATPNSPDTTASTNTNEPCPPSEPLLGGAILDGLSFVASSDRWWAMYPTFQGSTVFTPFQKDIGRGLAAPYGICTDKSNIYFWAKDGICATGGGGFKSLTDVDLFLLFPHDDVQASNITRNGVTYYAPDYSRAAEFRLTHVNGYLYADYQDSTGTPRTLVCFLKTGGWSQDSYANAITCRCAMAQPEGTLTSNSPALYGLSIMADNAGNVYAPSNLTGDNGTSILCVVATFEYNGDDVRATEIWGDEYVDCLPSSTVTAIPQALGASISGITPTIISASTSRQFVPVSTGGGTFQNFLGLLLTWTDFASSQTSPTILYAWQPFLYDQPDIITDRAGDYEPLVAGFGAAYARGFVLRADTFGANKSIAVRSSDDNSLHFPVSTINQNNQSSQGYAFTSPFVAHLVRWEPQDLIQWRFFDIRWIADPWPELTTEVTPWMDVQPGGAAAWLQGFIIPMENGTTGQPPTLTLVYDGGATVTPTPSGKTLTANEKTPIAYSLTTPVIAHQVQLQPVTACRLWMSEIQWIAQPTPELGITWATQSTAHGMAGYQHIGRIQAAYASTTEITLTITSFDGTSPQAITLPATTGAYERVLLTPTFNKGTLYGYSATSTSPFQIYLNDWIVYVREWGSTGPYTRYRLLGGAFGDKAGI